MLMVGDISNTFGVCSIFIKQQKTFVQYAIFQSVTNLYNILKIHSVHHRRRRRQKQMQSVNYTSQAVHLQKFTQIYFVKIDDEKYNVNNNNSVTVLQVSVS